MRWPSRLLADSGLLRRRGAALALALFIELLLLSLLLYFVPPLPGRKQSTRTNVFGIEASKGEESPDRKPAEKRQKKAARAQTVRSQPETRPPPPVPQPIETPVPAGPPTFLKLSRNDYQQGDIAKVRSRAPSTETADAADAGGGGGSRPDDSEVVGKAPNGEALYAANWYRKPTHAELDPYWPRGRAKSGIGRIMCRTAPRYRLVDCRIIGESPAGSGFGYAALQASWQFLMRPPRKGGKDLIGAWVIVEGEYETVQR